MSSSTTGSFSSRREELVFLAEVAAKMERETEVLAHITEIAQMDVDLTPKELNILLDAFTNVVGPRRRSVRAIAAVEGLYADGVDPKDESRIEMALKVKSKVVSELQEYCCSLLSTLDDHVIPSCQTNENLVHFWKMKADYHRYLAEIQSGDSRTDALSNSEQSYLKAVELCNEFEFPPHHLIRLGVALNFSVFRNELLDDLDGAQTIAIEAFQSAIDLMDDLEGDDEFAAKFRVMQLLKGNLAIWTAESESETETETDEDEDEGRRVRKDREYWRRKRARDDFENKFQDAATEDEVHRDATLIMQMLLARIREWTEDEDDEDREEEDESD